MTKVIGVIPARWASTRFEGKLLKDLSGQTVLQRVWQQVQKSRLLNDVMIACDDQRIFEHARGFGAKVVMTSVTHTSGTDRIAEAVAPIETDIVINIQGDEPLIHPDSVDKLAAALQADGSCQMATLIKVIGQEAEYLDPNVVKVVIDQNGYAIYFSRAAIPFNRDRIAFSALRCFKHIGMYGYRKDFLIKFRSLPASRLEQTEKLEQLRALEAGIRIKTVVTEHDSVGIDTPQDLSRVEELLKRGCQDG